MATTTPNFGWPVPTSTDLVKDGAVAIEGLGDAIDASLLDLKGGTTNQVLAKNSNTDMDFKWVADASGIPATILDAKGDLIAATAADTAARLAVGTNGQVLTADSAESTGLKWATPATGSSGLTLISTQTASDVASITFDNVFNSTYLNYLVTYTGVRGMSTQTNDLYFNYRYAGPTTQTTTTYAISGANSAGTSITLGSTTLGAGLLSRNLGDASYNISGQMFIRQVGNSSQYAAATGQTNDTWGEELLNYTIWAANTRTYTGFIISASAGNISGTFTVYGLAKS
jgi:hypothetical protein